MPNPDEAIADGVTCEMTVSLAPVEAAAVPRSALVFSDDGRLGVRIADEKNQARFMPIAIVDDGRESVWVSGLKGATRVIVVGQDFVKDGDAVEAVTAAEAHPPKRSRRRERIVDFAISHARLTLAILAFLVAAGLSSY
jgi:multidrug efflux system membrane fusion protein